MNIYKPKKQDDITLALYVPMLFKSNGKTKHNQLINRNITILGFNPGSIADTSIHP